MAGVGAGGFTGRKDMRSSLLSSHQLQRSEGMFESASLHVMLHREFQFLMKRNSPGILDGVRN